MAIIVNEKSKILIQGITGSVGKGFAKRMLVYHSPLVAGVTPNKGGQFVHGVPVYNSVEEAVYKEYADTSLIIVPPKLVEQAALEAIDAGIKTIVVYSEGVPIHDSMRLVQYANLHRVNLFGPNSAGVVSPGKANVSDIDDSILRQGKIGVVSRSGTLTYEIVEILKKQQIGISTIVCLGGDPIVGVHQRDILELFEQDEDTDAVIYIGEIGGTDEVTVAETLKGMNKPVFAYIAGQYAPKNKRMGHAGAIINNENESASRKRELLELSGAKVVKVVTELEGLLKNYFNSQKV
ncbi:succinate--CoA ligase subunit alpha [Pseudalkalibacillus decolorationis]|uniref:succinate--CoA ligase subunit alpha n=1 Tax=Pseudalkalibacillus decolorationis TaxID=163879 RepID=UPI002148925F|nr:CoA-binding protein [Pseudalkalibacillus decolorationis]